MIAWKGSGLLDLLTLTGESMIKIGSYEIPIHIATRWVAMLLLLFLLIATFWTAIGRILAGKYILMPRFPESTFVKRRISGRKNYFRDFTTSSLWVAVLPGEVRTGYCFPFNCGPCYSRWEISIPAETITSVTSVPILLEEGRRWTKIEYLDTQGKACAVWLDARRDRERFEEAIAAARAVSGRRDSAQEGGRA